MNMIEYFEVASKMIDENSTVGVVYMDFNTAFDKIRDGRLIQKIEVHADLVDWFQNRVGYGRQRLVGGMVYSDWKSMISDVSQRSVLGPLLFVVHINDLYSNVNGLNNILVDDTNIVEKWK